MSVLSLVARAALVAGVEDLAREKAGSRLSTKSGGVAAPSLS